MPGGHDAAVDLHRVAGLGLLIIDADTFRFRHPLVRSAIVGSADPAERRAVHQALAAAVGADPDRAVWHRALATTAAQESLAAELEAGADRAAARGAPGLAEEWLKRAAELSQQDRPRGHRLLRAAELAFEVGHHQAGLRGDSARAMDLAAEVERQAAKDGNRSLLNGVQLVRGLAALGDGRPGDAVDEFGRMVDPDDIAYQYPQCAWVIDYLAEAATLSGRGEEVRRPLRHIEELAGGTPAPGVVRALAYARAVLADDAAAEAAFAHAGRLKAAAPPWYGAWVDLAYGSWLRRQRRVAESRRPLSSAQAVFDALGAGAWSARAIQELAATGRRSRQHEPDAWAKLSAQELQVSQLAAQGLTNREIGERLYLSHRTVSSHLYRAFPKLGVRSRAQLHLALNGLFES